MSPRYPSSSNAPRDDASLFAPVDDLAPATGLSGVSDVGRRSLGRIAAGLVPTTFAIQGLSLVSSVAMARTLGASNATDAYFLALSVPVVVSAILLVATRLGAIPTLTSIKHAEPLRLGSACSEIVTVTLTAAAGLAALTTALALLLMPLATNGPAASATLTRVLILELSPYAVTGALAGVLGAVLAVEGRFATAVLVLGFEPLLKTILVLTAGPELGVQSLVLGNLGGSSLAVVVLWRLVGRRGIQIRLVRGRQTAVARTMLRTSAPLLVAQSVLQVNPLVDRVMASGLSHGSVTVLDLALRLVTVPVALLGTVLIAPLTASWSARYSAYGWEGLRESLGRVLVVAAAVLPLIAVIIFVLRFPLVRAIYAGGAYSSRAVDETASALGMFILGFPAQLLIVPLATLFIVQSDAMVPLKIAVANVVLNVVLNASLRGPLGVPGLALSTAMTLTILCVVYVVVAHRRWGSLGLRRSGRALGLSLGSAAILGLAGMAAVARVDAGSRGEEILLILVVATIAVAFHSCVLWLGGGMRSLRSFVK